MSMDVEEAEWPVLAASVAILPSWSLLIGLGNTSRRTTHQGDVEKISFCRRCVLGVL